MNPLILWIARKEFTEMIRDGRFRWAAGITFVLLTASLIVGWQQYAQVKRQTEAAQREERERWLNQGRKTPHSAAHFGLYAFKPQIPPSLIDQGINAYAGTMVFLEAHNQNLLSYKPATDGLALRRYGELTAAATLQMLIPLLIILLAYSAFVGEREAGTLRQLLSLGVRRQYIAFGKALGLTGPLLLLLVPATCIGVLAVALNSDSQLLRDSILRLALMSLSYLLYFGIFIGITLTVSAMAATSRQALLVLLAFWFVNSLMMPQIMTDLARKIYQPPTSIELAEAIRGDVAQLEATAQQRRAEVERRLLNQYGVERVQDLPVNVGRFVSIEDEAAKDKIQNEHFNRLYDIYSRQDRLYQAGTLLAPMLGVQSFSMGLAGTDFAQHRDFAQAAEQYRQQLVRTVDESAAYADPAAFEDFMGTGVSVWYAEREIWERVPPFTYSVLTVASVVGNYKLSIIILLLWFAAVAAITSIAVLKVRIV